MKPKLQQKLDEIATKSVVEAHPLSHLIALAKKLDLLPLSVPVITVGGTNGKGSSVAFLEAILLQADYRVGAFTSPHLLSYNERIRIDGLPIDDESLYWAFNQVLRVQGEQQLTYFEYATLAALVVFKHIALDVVILEVGLGGRLDPVNIVDADLVMLLTIALDHVDKLGDTRDKIAAEKAGIMRRGVPLVCGDPKPPAILFDLSSELGAPMHCFKIDFNIEVLSDRWHWQSRQQQLSHLPLPKLPLQNAAAVLMALELLHAKLPVSRRAIDVGLSEASLLGRMQVLSVTPKVIVDVAHNPESATYLAQQLAAKPVLGRTFAVVSMLGDKDIAATLASMEPLVDVWLIGELDNERAAAVETIAAVLADHKIKSCYTFRSILLAYDAAIAQANVDDRVVVFGSFYTVAAILKKED